MLEHCGHVAVVGLNERAHKRLVDVVREVVEFIFLWLWFVTHWLLLLSRTSTRTLWRSWLHATWFRRELLAWNNFAMPWLGTSLSPLWRWPNLADVWNKWLGVLTPRFWGGRLIGWLEGNAVTMFWVGVSNKLTSCCVSMLFNTAGANGPSEASALSWELSRFSWPNGCGCWYGACCRGPRAP